MKCLKIIFKKTVKIMVAQTHPMYIYWWEKVLKLERTHDCFSYGVLFKGKDQQQCMSRVCCNL
jgi:hypothetical protein